jgi:hypothetical protein
MMTKWPQWIAQLTKKQMDFSLKIERGGKTFLELFRFDCPPTKSLGTVNSGA